MSEIQSHESEEESRIQKLHEELWGTDDPAIRKELLEQIAQLKSKDAIQRNTSQFDETAKNLPDRSFSQTKKSRKKRK